MAENNIEINVKLNDQVSGVVGKVKSEIEDIGKSTQKVSNNSKGFAENFKQNWLIVGAAVTGVIATFKDFVASQAASEKASATLNAALKNQGIYTRELQSEMEDYASSLEKVTTFSDESIVQAQAMLVSAGLQGDALKEVTKLTLDYAAKTGTDVVSASNLFSKAVQGNTAMLARNDPALKNADGTMKSFSESVAILQKKYGGFSEAVANTPTGKLIQFGNAFDNFKETLGQVISIGIEPFIVGLTWLFTTINTSAAPIKYFAGTLVVLTIAFAGLIPVLGLFGITLSAAIWPITAIVVGVSALVAGIIAVKGAIDSITGKKKVDISKNTTDTIKQKNIQDYNKDEKPIDFKKGIDDFTKAELQKTNILKQQVDIRKTTESKYLEDLAALKAAKAEQDLQQTQAELIALDAYYAEQQAKYAGNAEVLASLEIAYNEQKISLEQERINRVNELKDAEYLRDKERMTGGLQSFINMLDIKKAMTKSQAQDFANWQSFMAGAEQSKNQEVAALAKAMAIYDIGLKTANAAMSAYNSMVGIPFVGPALAVGAAAAAVAWGTEQANKVSSMKPALAEGGMVRQQVGGQSVTIGEGRNDEAVVPLDDPATAQRIQQAAGGGGGQQVIQLVVDGMVLAETVVQGYNKGQNIGTVTRLK